MSKHSVAYRARRKRARDRRKLRRMLDTWHVQGDSVDRADYYYSRRLGF